MKYLRDRNPGVSHMSVERTLSCLKQMDVLENAVMIVDPVSRKVCDKMDKDLIKQVADRYGVEMIITDGSGKPPEVPSGRSVVIMMTKEGYQ